MFTGICSERERLLRVATAAVNLHNETVSELANRVAKRGREPNSEEFAIFKRQMQASYETALASWDTYRKHVEEHGC